MSAAAYHKYTITHRYTITHISGKQVLSKSPIAKKMEILLLENNLGITEALQLNLLLKSWVGETAQKVNIPAAKPNDPHLLSSPTQ